MPSELEDVKRQPWFNSINWNKLDSKEIVPSLVPDVRVFQHPVRKGVF